MKKQTLQQTAYDLLKARITSCEFQPGMFLNTVELQTLFGFSRTPIREALARLEQDNLVNFYPQKGFVVSEVGLSTITAIFETRIVIEPYIVANYGHLVDEEALKRMSALFSAALSEKNPSMSLYMAYDDAFHRLLCGVCPNIYLVQVLENISAQAQRVRILSRYAGVKLHRICKEHVDIIETFLEKNFALASRKIAAHLGTARKNSFRVIGE